MIQVILTTDKSQRTLIESSATEFKALSGNNINFCDETCLLDGEIPIKMEVFVTNATLSVDKLNYISTYKLIGKDMRETKK